MQVLCMRSGWGFLGVQLAGKNGKVVGSLYHLCIPPMTYFKGTNRAIYTLYTQRLGQYIFIALWSLQNCTAGCFQY